MKSNILLISLALIPLIMASLVEAQTGSVAIGGATRERSDAIEEVLEQVGRLPTTLQPRARKHATRAEVYHPDESYQGKTAPKPLPHNGIVVPRPANNCYLPGKNGINYHICVSPNRACPAECVASRPPFAAPPPPHSG